MERISITEVDNTSNVEALSSYDVVYVPGFSINEVSPVMEDDQESLFRNPRLVTSKFEFKRLFGDTCPTFPTDQLYPVATATNKGFPSSVFRKRLSEDVLHKQSILFIVSK